MNPEKNQEKENPEENIEKYFDESNYSTLVVGPDKFVSPKKLLTEEVFATLTSSDLSVKDGALQLLKQQNAQQTLIDAIEDEGYAKRRQVLVAACWESGMDFSKHINTFLELAEDKDLMVSLEAITVLDQIENFESKEILQEAIATLSDLITKKHPNAALMQDLKDRWSELQEEL